jgi:SsrA-binding protein
MRHNFSPEISNRKASFEYHLLQSWVAGIVLTGPEIKAIRSGKGSLVEAYGLIRNGELWLRGMNIPAYDFGTHVNHDALRPRKLLLKKQELDKIESKVKEKGISIIPVRLFFNERGYAKIEIALGRGKKTFDKRETLKQKEGKRELERTLKRYR